VSGSQLRIGDADRETAARELGEHFALGRITVDEHAERLDRIWAARTQAELAPVFADLPRRAVTRDRSTSSGRAGWGSWQPPVTRPRGRRPAIPFLLTVLLVVIVAALVLSHLSLLVVALLLYVFGVRRLARRGHRHPRCR
jgi:Flp pilus assembly protein TadB